MSPASGMQEMNNETIAAKEVQYDQTNDLESQGMVVADQKPKGVINVKARGSLRPR